MLNLKSALMPHEGIVGMVNYVYNEANELSHYKRLYFHYDALGSVSLITNEIGVPEQRYTYSPFGSCINVEGDPVNSLQFIGRYGGYTDNDTGLIYFWHRWYNADDGRWVSRDPIGVAGGINLYGYVGNDVLNIIDISGLAGVSRFFCVRGICRMQFDEPFQCIKSYLDEKDCELKYTSDMAKCIIGWCGGNLATDAALALARRSAAFVAYGSLILDVKCVLDAREKYRQCVGK